MMKICIMNGPGVGNPPMANNHSLRIRAADPRPLPFHIQLQTVPAQA